MRVIVVGAGGHGQVVGDIILRMADVGIDISLVGFVDDAPSAVGQLRLCRPVLGPVNHLASIEHDALLIAVGSNEVRRRLAAELDRNGEQYATAIHPKAVLAPDVVVEAGAIVCAGVIVNTGTSIGAHAIVNTGATVDHHNQLGAFVHIAPGVHLGGDVSVGAGTLIGIGSTVLPQRSIGEWSVIGGGSVVTRNLPANVTALGIPARVRKPQ